MAVWLSPQQGGGSTRQHHEVDPARKRSAALVQNFLSDGTVLVADSSNRGKGSPTFIDSARRLGAEELKTIDDFVQDTHNNSEQTGSHGQRGRSSSHAPAALAARNLWSTHTLLDLFSSPPKP